MRHTFGDLLRIAHNVYRAEGTQEYEVLSGPVLLGTNHTEANPLNIIPSILQDLNGDHPVNAYKIFPWIHVKNPAKMHTPTLASCSDLCFS